MPPPIEPGIQDKNSKPPISFVIAYSDTPLSKALLPAIIVSSFNLEILLNNSKTEEMVARVSKGQNDTQDVPYRAQLNYLKGLVYIERDEKELAKKALNMALTLSPDFQNASDKLGSL